MDTRPIQSKSNAAAEKSGRRAALTSRIRDYQASSLAKDDPLEANLGFMTSYLMLVAQWLGEALEQAMTSGPPNLDRLSQMLPGIDAKLRVARQIDRFAQLELRMAKLRKPDATDQTAAKPPLGAPSDSDNDASEDGRTPVPRLVIPEMSQE